MYITTTVATAVQFCEAAQAPSRQTGRTRDWSLVSGYSSDATIAFFNKLDEKVSGS